MNHHPDEARQLRYGKEQGFTCTPSFKTDTVREFADLMKRKYGKELSEYEAEEALGRLVRFFELLNEMDHAQKKVKSVPAIESSKNEAESDT